MPKNENTFRFVRFHERLKDIHVDIVRRRHRFSELPGRDADSFFYETLEKWSDLNGTEHFDNFKRDIPNNANLQTYAQILHQQNVLSEVLRRHLAVENSLCVSALLELTIAFGRDLQTDFYEHGHFWPFMDCILALVTSPRKNTGGKSGSGGNYDPELLEGVFSTLAHLLKLSWRQMTRSLLEVFDRFRPLISHRRLYLRRFASEALSFLVRKTSNLKEFLLGCFNGEEDLSDLLFEAMRGATGRFHSRAGELLSITLDLLENEDDGVVQKAFQLSISLHSKLSGHAVGEFAKPILHDILFQRTFSIVMRLKETGIDKTKSIQLLQMHLHLLNIWLQQSKRRTFFDLCFPAVVRDIFMPVMDDDLASGEIQHAKFWNIFVDIAASVFSQRGVIDVCRSEFERFTRKILSTQYDTAIALALRSGYITRLAETSADGCGIVFELCCVSAYGDMVERMLNSQIDGWTEILDTILATYCRILGVKEPRGQIGGKYNKDVYDLYPGKTFVIFKKTLENCLLEMDTMDSTKLASCISIYSNVVARNAEQTSLKILDNILVKMVNDPTSVPPLILYSIFHSLTRTENGLKMIETISPAKLIDILEAHCSTDGFVWSLRAADGYFGCMEEGVLANSVDGGLYLKAIEKLSGHFTNSSHSVRLLVGKVLCRLQRICCHPVATDVSNAISIFDIFCTAESTFPLTMDNYRNRLLSLRKLSFEEFKRHIPSDNAHLFTLIPLKMLIGQLHVNFALTWDSVLDLIASHMRGLGNQEDRDTAQIFWQFFAGEILTMASDKARNVQSSAIRIDNDTSPFYTFWCPPQSVPLDDDRPDPLNYRYQLWRVVEKCSPEYVEWKTRHLSELILDLAEKELKLFNDDPAKVTWENLVDDSMTAVSEDSGGKGSSGLRIKTMITMLRTYSRFQSIKSISKEPAMTRMFTKLLMHQRSDVQHAALDCIMAYRSKSLLAYKEHFEQLLDDKQFRDGLVLFQIDKDAPDESTVDLKHRPEVVPVLMRLLYGRLLGKTGSSKRKMPIFYFLAGCNENELNEFLRLLLVPVEACLARYEGPGPLGQQCESIVENYDLRQSLCPRKLLGVLSNLHIVFRKLGHLFTENSKSGFWRLLSISSAIVERLRREKQTIHRKYWRIVKDINKTLMTVLVDFFVCFGDDYHLGSIEHADEVKALFSTTCSQVRLKKLANGEGEGRLISLFHCWSQSPRLASLMNYSHDETCTTSVSACVRLLLQPACVGSIQHRVVTVLRDLSVLPMVATGTDRVSDGVEMLKPHVMDLLAYMRGKLKDGEVDGKRTHNKGSALNELDLQLLSNLTVCVNDEEASESLMVLLLPGLEAKRAKSEIVTTNTLTTLCRLAKNVGDCTKFHEPISRLFSKIIHRNSRALLCELWPAAFVENRRDSDKSDSDWEKRKFMAQAVADWNSWDLKRLDEPDFDRRISAHNEIRRRMEKSEVVSDANLSRLILHQCAFSVLEEMDLSLRDNASFTLRKLIESWPSAVNDSALRLQLVNSDLLPLLKRGFRSQREEVRLEFVAILASAVRAFPQHPRFVGLDALAPADGDPETDLFENLRHMQLHRRGRALRRLSEKIEQQSVRNENEEVSGPGKVSAESVYLYFLPLSMPWPYVDAIANHQSALIEEVVRLVRMYARYQASWKRYESLLKYYLGRLQRDTEKKKMTVKLLTALLDGFRFDLTNVNISQERKGNMDVDMEKMNEDGSKMSWKIFTSLTQHFLPRLYKTLNRPLQTEMVHKTMRKSHYDEDEQVAKIPIALALVKLLKKLPVAALESNLPGILYKVCQLLKSRSFTVREQTRKTLCSLAIELGPRYLPFIVREMRSILTRGYQTHVLIFTIHAILNALADELRPGDLDQCLEDILEICNEDLFGAASEEKEVIELTKNLKEARAHKTFVTYTVLGRLVGVGCLDKVLEPLKKTLETRHTYKAVSRISDALHHFATGMNQNEGLTEEMVFVYIHRALTAYLPMLSATHQPKQDPQLKQFEEESGPPVRQRSCFILDPEPGRVGATAAMPKMSRRNNIHVLLEFALDALFMTLKKIGHATENGEIEESVRQRRLAMLDPLVGLLYQCSTTAYSKTVAWGLRCFCYLAKWYPQELPALENADIIGKLMERLFILLNDYAGLGRAGNMAKGSEFAAAAEVLAITFKTMATVIQTVDACQLTSDQLRLLLHYVDEDLMDNHRQAAAFALIRSILSKRYRCEKDAASGDLLTVVMQRVRDMSVQSQADHIRSQCRQLVLKHAINYGMLKGDKSLRFFRFYCAQLGYEFEDGRLSALECLNSLFELADKKKLNSFASMIYVFLSTRLIKDESAKCKKVVAMTLKNLMRKVHPNEVNSFVAMALCWLRAEEVSHKQLGAQLIGLFVEAEGEQFRNRLSTVLPVLSSEMRQLRDQHYSIGANEGKSMDDSNQEEMSMDRLLYLLLSSIRKIFEHCPSLMRNEPECMEWMNELWECVESLLGYPHPWVQLIASQLFGMLFAAYTPDELSLSGQAAVRSQEYLLKSHSNADDDQTSANEQRWTELTEAFIQSLRMRECQAAMAEQVIKNLVFVARVVMKRDKCCNEENATNGKCCTLAWLSNRLVRICRVETSKTPKCFLKRSAVFKWIAAVALHVPKEQLDHWLPLVLPPLHRQMTVGEASDSEIKQLTNEVCELLRNRVAGIDVYSRHWVACQRVTTEKRTFRKRKLAEEAITNPEATARRKIRKHQKRAELRKRKMGGIGKKVKRRKMEKEINNIDEVS